MQTIVIVLDPTKLDNPDLDLRYLVPDQVEAVTQGDIADNGYDYLDSTAAPRLGIWLDTKSATEGWPQVLKLLREETFLDNDLSQSAELYISTEDAAAFEDCIRVYPE